MFRQAAVAPVRAGGSPHPMGRFRRSADGLCEVPGLPEIDLHMRSSGRSQRLLQETVVRAGRLENDPGIRLPKPLNRLLDAGFSVREATFIAIRRAMNLQGVFRYVKSDDTILLLYGASARGSEPRSGFPSGPRERRGRSDCVSAQKACAFAIHPSPQGQGRQPSPCGSVVLMRSEPNHRTSTFRQSGYRHGLKLRGSILPKGRAARTCDILRRWSELNDSVVGQSGLGMQRGDTA